VQECLETTWISSIGRFIPQFENDFARFCNANHAVACNNGTSALHLALLGMGVQPGDEILVPTLTFVATANAVTYCGARPVLVDSEPRSMNMDPARIEEKITSRTRGIVVVHLYGHPADMDPILEIAGRRGLFVIEDAAEAHGALYKGRKVGAIAELGTFSFFGNKIMTTGEGGMVTVRDKAIRDRIRQFRGQGMDPDRRYWFPEIGYNYRMTNIQAALGLAQLEQIDSHLTHHRQVAEWYRSYLAPLADFLSAPFEEVWAHHVYWLFTIILHPSAGLSRDQFMTELSGQGIETRPVFYPMHVMPPFLDTQSTYPVADMLARNGVSLPTHAAMTEEDVAYVADRIRALCAV
jgi:perosamine synthetase